MSGGSSDLETARRALIEAVISRDDAQKSEQTEMAVWTAINEILLEYLADPSQHFPAEAAHIIQKNLSELLRGKSPESLGLLKTTQGTHHPRRMEDCVQAAVDFVAYTQTAEFRALKKTGALTFTMDCRPVEFVCNLFGIEENTYKKSWRTGRGRDLLKIYPHENPAIRAWQIYLQMKYAAEWYLDDRGT